MKIPQKNNKHTILIVSMLRHNFSILSGVVPSRGWGLIKGGIYFKYGLKKQQSFTLYFIFTPSKQYNINTMFCFNNIFLTLSIDKKFKQNFWSFRCEAYSRGALIKMFQMFMVQSFKKIL